MTGERAEDRSVVAIAGADRQDFLQGIVTNDLRRLHDGPVYAALLTPKGKYLADFLILDAGDRLLVDVAASLAPDLLRRLSMYKLRADVTIAETGIVPRRGLGDPPPGAVADPRHPALGWRAYDGLPGGDPAIDWDAIRVEHCIPESGIELIPNETFILEAGFERLHGVDHRKGCYVGQEVTARMKHKTELRKGLVTVEVDGDAAPGATISTEGREVGRLFTRSGTRAIAWLRFDKAAPEMSAEAARVLWSAA